MRLSELEGLQKFRLRDAFEDPNCVIRLVRHHYNTVISLAVTLAEENRISSSLRGFDRQSALRNLPPAVYGFQDDAIAVYVLSRGFHVLGHGTFDVAVLQMKAAPFSSLVLYGENVKQSLGWGVAEAVFSDNADEDLRAFMQAWKQFSHANFMPYSPESSQRLSSLANLYDPVDFIQRYLYPIGLGFNGTESYSDEIKALLQKAGSSTKQYNVGAPLQELVL
jgi:hypothetical protein